MRVLVLVHATPDSEQGNYADHADEFEAMGKYNEDLVKAGIMLAADGLEPPTANATERAHLLRRAAACL